MVHLSFIRLRHPTCVVCKNFKLDKSCGLPSTISLAVHDISLPAFLATQVYSPVSESWTSMMFNLRSLPSDVNLCLGLSRKLVPSFIQEVMAVEGDTSHSNTAEEPIDSASCNTMSLSFLVNFRGTGFNANLIGSSGGEGPFPPGLWPRPLPPSPGDGVCLAATSDKDNSYNW